ncbi:hypothetical protein H8E07_22540 [bacterium]|nr:hypothetical protein [bacterium]
MKTHTALLAALLLMAPAVATGTFETISSIAFPEQYMAPDARSEAMGLAYTAVAEGPAGLWWNPAAQLELRNVSVGYHQADQLSDGTEFTALSAAFEMGYLRLGAYQNMFSTSGAVDDLVDPLHIAGWNSRTRAGGIALDLGRLMFGEETTLFASAGINFKSFESKWVDVTNAKASDRDLGVIVGTRQFLGDSDDVHRGWVSWRLGAALVNIDRTALEFPADKAQALRLEQRGRVGLALEGRHGWRHGLGHALRWLLTADSQKSKHDDGWSNGTLTRYGAELTLLGLVSGRLGQVEHGEGSAWNGTTYGGGLSFVPPGAFFGVRADYASVPYGQDVAVETAHPDAPRRLDRYSLAVSLKFWSPVR